MPLLVVDLAARSANWSLPAAGGETIRRSTPMGWEVRMIGAATVSDGDGSHPPSDEAVTAVRDADAYFGFGMSRPLFLAAPRLRWIHSAAAGVGSALFPELRNSPVLFTNSAGIHAAPIAEQVLAGVLMLVRSLDIAQTLQRAGKWDKSPFVGPETQVRELADAHVLVVGAGGLGSAIARRFSALGARCVGLRRRPGLGIPDGFARVDGPDALDRELPSADVLVLSAPATPATDRLITAGRLDLLPRQAIVVNVARGSLLDETALVDRVTRGRLRGAVLDVFQQEPLASDSPLWQLPQVVLTPHVSAVSPARFWERELALFTDNWRRFAHGEPLRNLVDKDAGY